MMMMKLMDISYIHHVSRILDQIPDGKWSLKGQLLRLMLCYHPQAGGTAGLFARLVEVRDTHGPLTPPHLAP